MVERRARLKRRQRSRSGNPQSPSSLRKKNHDRSVYILLAAMVVSIVSIIVAGRVTEQIADHAKRPMGEFFAAAAGGSSILSEDEDDDADSYKVSLRKRYGIAKTTPNAKGEEEEEEEEAFGELDEMEDPTLGVDTSARNNRALAKSLSLEKEVIEGDALAERESIEITDDMGAAVDGAIDAVPLAVTDELQEEARYDPVEDALAEGETISAANDAGYSEVETNNDLSGMMPLDVSGVDADDPIVATDNAAINPRPATGQDPSDRQPLEAGAAPLTHRMVPDVDTVLQTPLIKTEVGVERVSGQFSPPKTDLSHAVDPSPKSRSVGKELPLKQTTQGHVVSGLEQDALKSSFVAIAPIAPITGRTSTAAINGFVEKKSEPLVAPRTTKMAHVAASSQAIPKTQAKPLQNAEPVKSNPPKVAHEKSLLAPRAVSNTSTQSTPLYPRAKSEISHAIVPPPPRLTPSTDVIKPLKENKSALLRPITHTTTNTPPAPKIMPSSPLKPLSTVNSVGLGSSHAALPDTSPESQVVAQLGERKPPPLKTSPHAAAPPPSITPIKPLQAKPLVSAPGPRQESGTRNSSLLRGTTKVEQSALSLAEKKSNPNPHATVTSDIRPGVVNGAPLVGTHKEPETSRKMNVMHPPEAKKTAVAQASRLKGASPAQPKVSSIDSRVATNGEQAKVGVMKEHPLKQVPPFHKPTAKKLPHTIGTPLHKTMPSTTRSGAALDTATVAKKSPKMEKANTLAAHKAPPVHAAVTGAKSLVSNDKHPRLAPLPAAKKETNIHPPPRPAVQHKEQKHVPKKTMATKITQSRRYL